MARTVGMGVAPKKSAKEVKEENKLKAENKALQDEIDTLKAENKALQDEIDTLKAENKALQEQLGEQK